MAGGKEVQRVHVQRCMRFTHTFPDPASDFCIWIAVLVLLLGEGKTFWAEHEGVIILPEPVLDKQTWTQAKSQPQGSYGGVRRRQQYYRPLALLLLSLLT